jgi:hypothetical protein
MVINTEDYLQVREAVDFLRARGLKRSEMWLKLQIMYERVESLKVFSSLLLPKKDLIRLAQDEKEKERAKPRRSSAIRAAAIMILLMAGARPLLAFDAHQIVSAIYWVEGGPKASSPYGVLAVPCATKKECKRVCLNTVKNTRQRWHEAGRPGDFLDFLADRYCPPSVDKNGNLRWKKNIRAIIKKGKR